MLRLCLSILLGLALQPPTTFRIVHIIYISTEPVADSTFTELLTDTERGIEFWRQTTGLPVDIVISSSIEVLSITGDLHTSFEWSRSYWYTDSDITLFILPESTPPLLGTSVAQSQTHFGLIWAIHRRGSEFSATIAHEFGHIVMNLPHAYEELYDIMGLTPEVAYSAGSVGCLSLERLERPCTRVWVPLVRF